jgi:hypothetical protein
MGDKMYKQWEPQDQNSNIPPYSSRLSLMASIITVVGDVLGTLGIALEKDGTKEIEEISTKEIGNLEQAVSENTNNKSLPDIGFALSLIGAILTTFGDTVSTASIAIGIDEELTDNQQDAQEKKEQEKKFREMQNQINSLQNEMKSMLIITDAMRREIISLQRANYYRDLIR